METLGEIRPAVTPNFGVMFTVAGDLYSTTFPLTPNIVTPSLILLAIKLGSPATLTFPLTYLPAATAVFVIVPGVIVDPPCTGIFCVTLPKPL